MSKPWYVVAMEKKKAEAKEKKEGEKAAKRPKKEKKVKEEEEDEEEEEVSTEIEEESEYDSCDCVDCECDRRCAENPCEHCRRDREESESEKSAEDDVKDPDWKGEKEEDEEEEEEEEEEEADSSEEEEWEDHIDLEKAVGEICEATFSADVQNKLRDLFEQFNNAAEEYKKQSGVRGLIWLGKQGELYDLYEVVKPEVVKVSFALRRLRFYMRMVKRLKDAD